MLHLPPISPRGIDPLLRFDSHARAFNRTQTAANRAELNFISIISPLVAFFDVNQQIAASGLFLFHLFAEQLNCVT